MNKFLKPRAARTGVASVAKPPDDPSEGRRNGGDLSTGASAGTDGLLTSASASRRTVAQLRLLACPSRFIWAPAWQKAAPHIFTPYVCTLDIGHAGPHEDAGHKQPHNDYTPRWTDETDCYDGRASSRMGSVQ